MKKEEFFMLAMRASEYRRKNWVISAFALIQENVDNYKTNPYSYRIVQTVTGFFFVDPNNNNELTKIDDGIAGEPLFKFSDTISIKANSVPNLSKDIVTTYGNLLFNYTVLIYAFGNKIPYVEGRTNPGKIEDLIIDRLKDNPKEDSERNDKDIYVDEYIKFCDAMFYLTGFTQLCTPAATAKTITSCPDIPALKARLLEENKDRLHDPAIVAKIDAELIKMDKEWMKGDPGENFLIKDKSYNIIRKKLYGMLGAEPGLKDGVGIDLIQNSLTEGWDIKKFPAMNNALRAGSFNRGAETQKGGESVKWLLRSSSNMNITADDCGSKIGVIRNINNSIYKQLIGFYVIVNEASILVKDEEDAKQYIGKRVMVRSPMFCKLDQTDYCKVCVGYRLSSHPTGLSMAVSRYGSVFMSIFMQAAHSKGLTVAKMDYKTSIL